MHGGCHDFVVSQTVVGWEKLPTGFGSDQLIPEVFKVKIDGIKNKQYFTSVLDIGSLDICGNQRDYDFCGKRAKWTDMVGCEQYIGIDLVEGPNVDMVMDGHDILFKDSRFDLVLCLSVLEHDADPVQTISEGFRVLKPGGIFLLSTVDENHPEHMEEHGVELPYNHINENDFKNWIVDALTDNKHRYKIWHNESDLFARIEKL